MALCGFVSTTDATARAASTARRAMAGARTALAVLAGGAVALVGWVSALALGAHSVTSGFYPAVLAGAWLGGVRASALVTTACAAIALRAHGSGAPGAELADVASFVAVGIALGLLGEARLRVRSSHPAPAGEPVTETRASEKPSRTLERLSAALAGAATRERVADSIVDAARTVLGAEVAIVRVIVEDGATIERAGANPARGPDEARRSGEEDARAAIADALRARSVVVLRGYRAAESSPGSPVVVAAPFVLGRRAVGAMALVFPREGADAARAVEVLAPFAAECTLLFDRCGALEVESALRTRAEASGALFRLIAEHAPDLVYRLRVTPIPAFEYVSPSARTLLGCTPEELYADATLALALVHPDDRERLAHLGDGAGDPMELRWVRRDGRTIWAELRWACVRDDTGVLVAIEGIARDITGRKRRELERESALALELEARARAEAAARAREDLLAMVSHDLRTPLNSIVLGARVAADALARGEEGARLRRRLASIAHAADRMGRLVEQLLDAASVEAGRMTLAPEPVDAEALVREAIELVSEAAAAKHVALRASCAAGVAVDCDRERVLQVLGNLLGNAIKFTPAGGRVEVEVEAEPSWARISVSDTGPGIPNDQLPCIFDRYWTGRLQRTSGTGLGLFIAKGIVEAHTGRLSVDSRVGRGTTFTFTLPRAQRPVATH